MQRSSHQSYPDLESLTPYGDGMKATFKPWRSAGTPPPSGSNGHSADQERITVTASFVIGCDGANSTVRDLMGFNVIDLGFHYDWLASPIMDA